MRYACTFSIVTNNLMVLDFGTFAWLPVECTFCLAEAVVRLLSHCKSAVLQNTKHRCGFGAGCSNSLALLTLRRVENARREARQVCSNVKITGMRGIFCSARSPGGRAGSRKNCEKNPANCAGAMVSRARRRLSMRGVAYSAGRAVICSMTVWTCSLRKTQRQSHADTQRHARR